MVEDDLTTRPGVMPDAPFAAGDGPFWGDEPGAWDTAFVGGLRLPGTSHIRGHIRRRHDRRGASGLNGHVITYLGDGPAEFSITVRLWTAQQLWEMQDVIKRLRLAMTTSDATTGTGGLLGSSVSWTPTKSKFPQAPLSVRHPALDMLGIGDAHLVEIGIPEPQGEPSKGVYELRLGFVEFTSQSASNGQTKTPVSSIESQPTALDQQLAAQKKPSQTNWKP